MHAELGAPEIAGAFYCTSWNGLCPPVFGYRVPLMTRQGILEKSSFRAYPQNVTADVAVLAPGGSKQMP